MTLLARMGLMRLMKSHFLKRCSLSERLKIGDKIGKVKKHVVENTICGISIIGVMDDSFPMTNNSAS